MKMIWLLGLLFTLSASGAELLQTEVKGTDIGFILVVKRQQPETRSTRDHQEDSLVFEYEVKNNSEDAWALFHQGHYGKSFKGFAYCEALGEQNITYSLKAFQEPSDRTCPLRTVPIIPKAVLLGAGETMRGRAFATLPPGLHTPFDDCAPLPFFPEKVDKARFCLGMARLSDAESLKVAQGETPVSLLEKQALLCTELFDLAENPD